MPPRSAIRTTPYGMSFYAASQFDSDGHGWVMHITPSSGITYEKCDKFPFPYSDGTNIHEEDFDMVFD